MEKIHPIQDWAQQRQRTFWRQEKLALERPPGLDKIFSRSCDLNGAFLMYADLSGCAHFESDLEGVNLNHARLSHTSFHGGSFEGASLEYADLTCVHMSKSTMDRVSLKCADLTGADFKESGLAHANLNGTNLNYTQLPLTALSDCEGWHTVKNAETARFFDNYGSTLITGISFDACGRPYFDISKAGASVFEETPYFKISGNGSSGTITNKEDPNNSQSLKIVEFPDTETYQLLEKLVRLGRPHIGQSPSPAIPKP